MKRLRKPSCLAAALTLVALALGAPQDAKPTDPQAKTVTFRAPAAPLERLLPELSKQIGLHLTAARSTAPVVMLIQVKDVPVGELLKRIAQAAGAEWSGDGDTRELLRTADTQRAQAREEVLLRAAELAKVLQPRIDQLTKKPSTSSESDTSSEAGQSSVFVATARGQGGPLTLSMAPSDTGPGADAITRLIQLIGVEALASLPPDSRTVFATSPTRMQRNLGFNAARIINAYIQLLREKRQPTQTQPEGGRRRQRMVIAGLQGNLDLVPAKACLVVTRSGYKDVLLFQLNVVDAQGALVARADSVLSPQRSVGTSSNVTLSNSDKKLDLSVLATQFAKTMQEGAQGGSTARDVRMILRVDSGGGLETISGASDQPRTPGLSKEWRDRIANPEANEPLALCPGEVLGKLADAAEVNLIACLPDSALVPAARTIFGTETTVGRIMAAAQAEWGLTATKDGGFLTMYPRAMNSSYEFRLDRNLLGKTLRSLASQGILTLDQRANYAQGEPLAPEDGNFEIAYYRCINAGEASRIMSGGYSGERKMLRFYAAIGIIPRQSLGAGKTLPVGSLGFAAKALLADMVYNSADGPAIMSPGPQGQGGRRQMMMQRFGMGVERTDALPDGIPNNATVTVQIAKRPVAFGVGPSGDRVAIDGSSLVLAGGGDTFSAQNPRFDQYLTGSLNTYTFNFQLSPTATFGRSLSDPQVDSGKPVPYDQLPADFRRQMEQMQNAMQQAVGRFQRRDQGPVNP